MSRTGNKGRGAAALDRRKAVARILKERGDTLVVTGLGAPSFDAFAAGDHPNNFYLWGGMGGAAMTGLGLALAQPGRRVLVLTGDGEMLMGMGSLATIAVQKPANLAIGIIDNEQYGETGGQDTHTAFGVDLAAIAGGAGFSHWTTVRTMAELEQSLPLLYEVQGPSLVVVKVGAERHPMALPVRDGPTLRQSFKAAVRASTAGRT